MSRRAARKVAMQLIYERMLGGDGGGHTKTVLLGVNENDPETAYINEAVEGVFENMQKLDDTLAANLINWTLDRLARVDLAIMRLACYEIMFRHDIPVGVSVGEAGELAHKFSTPEAVGFITAVLSGAAKTAGRSDELKDNTYTADDETEPDAETETDTFG